MVVSNMFISQIVDINWTGLGDKRTVCRYQTMLGESPLLSPNIVTIAGGLGYGRRVLDVVLNQQRRQLLEMEQERLIVEAQLEAKPY